MAGKDLKVTYKADTKDVEAGQRRVAAGAKDVGGQFDKLGSKADKLGKVGRGMTRNVTLPIVALGAASIKAFSSFDDAMTQSTSIMGKVSDEMRSKMEETARAIALTTKVSAAEAAEAYFFLASAGLDAEQSIAALPQVAAFATAGMFDMAQATDLLTDAQSALGLASDDAAENLENMARVSDVLVGANTLANASVEQFATALTSKAGTAMKTFGIELEDGVAVLAKFADAGIKGEQGGTLYSRVLEGLAENARKNTDAFDKFGISVFDANGVMRPTADIVREMEKGFAGMTIEQKEAAIASLGFNKLAKQGLLVLLDGADGIDEYADSLREMGGVTQDVSEKQMESFQNQMGLVKDKLIDAGISIGSVLAPMLLKLAGGFAAVVGVIMDLPGPVKAIIVGFLALAAVAGPLLIITSKLIKAWILWRKAMLAFKAGKAVAAFGAISKGATTAATAMGRAALAAGRATVSMLRAVAVQTVAWIKLGITALAGAAKVALAWLIAIGPIALVVAAVIAVAVLIIKHWDKVKAGLTAAWNAIKASAIAVFDFLKMLFLNFTPLGQIIQHWNTIKSVLSAIWNGLKAAASAVWNAITSAISTAVNTVRSVLSAVWNGIRAALSAVWNTIRSVASSVWNGITAVIRGAASTVGGIIDRIVGTFQRIIGIFSRVIDGARRMAGGVIGQVKRMVDWIVNKVKTAISWLSKLPFVPGSPIPLVVDSKAAVDGVIANFKALDKKLPKVTANIDPSIGALNARVAAAGGSFRGSPGALGPVTININVSGGATRQDGRNVAVEVRNELLKMQRRGDSITIEGR